MRMIGCVSPVTGGTLRVLGLDPRTDGPRIRARLGVVPQEDTLDVELTVRENLLVYGRYFGLPRAQVARSGPTELLDFVQLVERADSKVEPLSGGMKRRLTIARSLINEPDMLLLDEPTTGLDPQARHVLWDRLFRLKQQGVTLVLTTHYMDEAEQLCDRLVVMDGGRIVAEGSPAAADPRVVDPRGASSCASRRARTSAPARRSRRWSLDGDLARAGVAGRGAARPRAALRRRRRRAPPRTVHRHAASRRSRSLVRRRTLEDVFLRLTGRTLVD